MANSRVDFYGETLIDITDTSAAASDVAEGKVFYTASGQRATGTASYQEKITLLSVSLSTSWTAVSGGYEQTVLTGQNAAAIFDLQPTLAQVTQLRGYGVTAIVALNVDGTVKVVCSGAKPTVAMTMQATKTMTY